MTLFVVSDPEGRITQASKVYDPEGYSDLLHEHGLKHIQVRTSRLVSPDTWHVMNDRPRIRPRMPIVVSKTTIKAGENDATLLTCIPKDAKFSAVATGGFAYHTDVVIPDGELEYSVPVPCVVRIRFELYPFQTFTVDIEVVA